MKKLFSLFVLGAAVLSANAQQTTVQGSKFLDNWSIGIDGGIQTNLHDWNAPQGGIGGITLNKEITPVYGISFDAHIGANNDANGIHKPAHFHNGVAIDNATFGAYSRVNLMNWFGGYKGTPRLFEIEALGGVGYGHAYNNDNVADVTGADYFFTKVGLNFNFNVGEKKAWSLNIKPAVVWGITEAKFDCRQAVGQLTAGVTYHFKNSNGEHYFTKAVLRDQSEIDSLNSVISNERARVQQERDHARKALDDKDRQIRDLKRALDECNGRPEAPAVTKTEKGMECYVYFDQGKSDIKTSQMPNVERISTFLKNHKESKVVINGYASPEGSAEVNEAIAQKRAEAVKTALVKKYKIDESRITATGKGVGDAFSEPDWNRVSICTIEK